MKKTIVKYLIILSFLLYTAGCSKFDDINTDPNAATTVTAGLLATNLILSVTRDATSAQKSFMQPFILAKYITWQEGQEDYQYNDLGRADFDRLVVLNNVPQMINYATSEQLKTSYTALGHFIRAWQFYQTTMQVGDIPYSEAISGENGNIKPIYDTQKEVFIGILNELDSANVQFANGSDFDGDPIYNGSTDSWRRLSNSFELHVLMNLFKKTDDVDLNVMQRFNNIVTNRPLMRDYNDNFALVYSDKVNQQYPWYSINSSNPSVIYPMVSATLINPLKLMQDRRLFYFAKPSPVQISNGKTASDWNAYIGVEPSASFSSLQTIHASKDFSDLNDRYADLANAEPVSMFSYSEFQFVLAEAAVRGWIGGSAEAYYEAGISSDMKFIANYTPADQNYNHGMPITDSYIQQYLSSVKLSGTPEQQITQIITQKYIADFLQGPDYNAWY